MHRTNSIFKKNNVLSKKKWIGVKYFLLAFPFILFVILFSYVPLFGWAYAFTDYKPGMLMSNMKFVGLLNFLKLFNEKDEILRVLRNTLVMSGLNIICSPLPVLFAIMLNEVRSSRFKKLIQTTTTLPNFISWIVVYGLAFSMFSNNGFINSIMTKLNLPVSDINLLGNNSTIWTFELCLGIWKSLGWNAIIYVAAIAGIDTELYDAAKVDGANKIKSIIHVTIPGILPAFLVLLLLGISNLLNNGFDQYFVFYNTMVADRIEVLDYFVYKVGILVGDYPYSIAIGILKTIISILLLFSVNAVSRKIRSESLI